MIDTPSKSDIAEINRILPDDLTVIENASTQSIWVLKNEYLLAEWDPDSREARVRLHLMECDKDVVELDLGKFSRALQHLNVFDFRITGDHTIPAQIGSDEIIKILIFEAPYSDIAPLREAIRWAYSVSRPAIEKGPEAFRES